MLLDVKNLSVSYGTHQILDSVSFSLSQGQWLMIVGPNGAGKSTIVNAISGGAPYTGSILFQQRDVRSMKSQERAKRIGILSQTHFVGYGFRVREVVGLGRYAYSRSVFDQGDQNGEDMVRQALEMTGLTELAEKSVLELSGGELQRTFLAQLFAQDPDILILDEPTNHLDLVYQKQIFSLIGTWLQQPGRAVISVVHDLSLAKAYGSHALLLQSGQVLASGEVSDVFVPSHLDRAFSMDVAAWMNAMLGQWR